MNSLVNTVIMTGVVILLGIFAIFVNFIAPKLEKRRAIKKLIALRLNKIKDTVEVEEKIINKLSELHDLRVKRSKWEKGWYIVGTRCYDIAFADGSKSYVIRQEYFPIYPIGSDEKPKDNGWGICGTLHKPDYYFKTKEEAESLRVLLLKRLIDQVAEKYKNDIDSETVWED